MNKKEIWAADTEDDSCGNVELINFYNGQEHFTFETQREALEWLTQTKGYLEIWCVNLQYDLINLFREKLSCLEICFVGSRVISANLKNHTLQFRDTLNHWKISVKEMGERIGLKKLEQDLFDGKKKPTKKQLLTRCRRDTEITYNFVMSMKTNYESFGCELKKTIGSTALTYFYSDFANRPSKPMNQEKLEFCLKGYYGGRTEIFFNKPLSGNIFYYDINSLYPFAMLGKFPVIESGRYVRNPNFEREGMSEITVEAPKLDIPYLPFRDYTTGRLLFPIGKFRGVYTHFEIREAKKLGYRIEKIHKSLEFASTCFPFKEFVESLYKKRMEAQKNKDVLLSDSYKLIMNNLYGKFGQGNEYQKLVPYKEKSLRNGDTIYGNMVLRTTIGEYPKHTNGVWSAYTTAYGRHLLYQAFTKVKRSGGLLIYGDTDSVIYEGNRSIFEESKELGGLKLEGEFSYAHFKLPKVYVLKSKTKTEYKAKGVPRAKAEDFFETGRAEFRRPYKIKETLRRNLSPKRKIPLIMNFWELTSKELNQKYDKRRVLRSGHTKPLIIGGEV